MSLVSSCSGGRSSRPFNPPLCPMASAPHHAAWRIPKSLSARAGDACSGLAVHPGRQTLGVDSPSPQSALTMTHSFITYALTPSPRPPPTLWKSRRLGACRPRKWKFSARMGRGCGSRIVKPHPHLRPCSRHSWKPVDAATHAQSRIFLAVQPVDFRKGIDGLAALCRQTLNENPLGGRVYVFRNRTGRR